MPSDAHLTGSIARLALNYGRNLDEAGIRGMLVTWREQLGSYAAEDVDAAVARLLADPEVRFFPPVAQVLHLTADARESRERHGPAILDAHGTVACTTCNDSGWLDAGSDEDDYWYVRPCPKACLPPLPGHGRRDPQQRRRRHSQQRLPAKVSAEAIEAQHRMTGDRPDPRVDQEPF